MADRPLRPATRRSLGEPLPHQQADRPRDHPEAADRFLERSCDLGRVSGINPGFPGLSPTTGQFPMHYSPVRRSSAGSKLPLLPLDLHVLSLPPAFNLSHDQTLQFKSYKNPKILYSCSRQNSISTSHCPDISYPKYLGQRPHELLGQFFKERLSCCSIKAAYSTSNRHLVNRYFSLFPVSGKRRKMNRLTACFEGRILHRTQPLSTAF